MFVYPPLVKKVKKYDGKQRDLVDSTIRLVSLSTWLFEAHPVIAAENVENANILVFDYHDKRIERRLAEVARSQLFLIALMGPEGFEPTERKIFSEIDTLLRRSGGCSPQSALIVGLCLRRISLLYRSSLMRYRKFTIDCESLYIVDLELACR